MGKTALITGVTGQDGFYLTELLIKKGYHVVGLYHDPSGTRKLLAEDCRNNIELIDVDIRDTEALQKIIKSSQPDELYNFASQSSPRLSWQMPLETHDINGVAPCRLFDIVKEGKKDCRIYQASSSEMYGDVIESPQNEQTPFNPINPYAASKLYAHHMARIYRQNFGMFISCGILFNHESPLRPLQFITQKVTYAAAAIKLGLSDSLANNEQGEPIVKNGKVSLGNLTAKKDWGFAGDYIEAMWLMLQQDSPNDFVIGSGQLRSIEELCSIAFGKLDLNWQDYIVVDERFLRPAETGTAVADITKAKEVLHWQPTLGFEELIGMMLDSHLDKLR